MTVPDDLHEQAALLADLVFEIAPDLPTEEAAADAGVLLVGEPRDALGGIWLMPGQVQARSPHTHRGVAGKDVGQWLFERGDRESLRRAVREAIGFLRAAAPAQ